MREPPRCSWILLAVGIRLAACKTGPSPEDVRACDESKESVAAQWKIIANLCKWAQASTNTGASAMREESLKTFVDSPGVGPAATAVLAAEKTSDDALAVALAEAQKVTDPKSKTSAEVSALHPAAIGALDKAQAAETAAEKARVDLDSATKKPPAEPRQDRFEKVKPRLPKLEADVSAMIPACAKAERK
jgi:hypothetical protein